MKKIKKTSSRILLGIFLISLFSTISGMSFQSNDSADVVASSDVFVQFDSNGGHSQFLQEDTPNDFEKVFIEIEEEIEEKNESSTFVNSSFSDFSSFSSTILPSYFNSISILSQPKRYLLFQALKIDC